MTIVLVLDTEQSDLLEASAVMMHAALDARARRMDPDKIISTSAGMSRAKLDSVLAQIRLGPLLDLTDYTFDDRERIFRLINALSTEVDLERQDEIWKALRSFMLYRPEKPQAPFDTFEGANDGVSGQPLAGASEVGEAKPASVWPVRHKHPRSTAS
jgi:hypothetical protein